MICFLISAGYGILGLILYFIWKAKVHLINGKFEMKIWREKNLHRFIYAIVMLLLLLAVFTIQPELLDMLKSMMGISFDVDGDRPKDASPVVLGLAVGSFVYGVNKTYSETKAA